MNLPDPNKFSTGWPDAFSKLAIALVSLCTLVTFLVTRCDDRERARKQEAALEALHGTNFLDYASPKWRLEQKVKQTRGENK